MAARSRLWCKHGHTWRLTTNLLMGLPRTDGGMPRLLIRACLKCPLAEAMHVLSWPGKIGLTNYEHWACYEKGGDWIANDVIYDGLKEKASWI